MGKIKILYISHEMSPFLELTNISKVTRELPQLMQERGCETRMLVPRFGCINERRNRLHEVIRLSGMNIVVNDSDNPLIIKVASLPSARMQVYFLDNEDYFQRKSVFNDPNTNDFYADNDERMIFFCKGAIETVKKLGWVPDVVHCHGWMSSLVPMYLKTLFKDEPIFMNAKIVYSVYENCFNDSLSSELSQKAMANGVTENDVELLTNADCSKLHMNAIKHSDGVIIGSQTIDSSVETFIQTSNKPVLAYTEEVELADAHYLFYEELVQTELAIA